MHRRVFLRGLAGAAGLPLVSRFCCPARGVAVPPAGVSGPASQVGPARRSVRSSASLVKVKSPLPRARPTRAGRWHATRDYAPRPLGDDGEVTLELAIAPPLEAGTLWIDVVAAGPPGQVRARLPLSWTWNP